MAQGAHGGNGEAPGGNPRLPRHATGLRLLLFPPACQSCRRWMPPGARGEMGFAYV
jgi:hypothetical protein